MLIYYFSLLFFHLSRSFASIAKDVIEIWFYEPLYFL